MSKKDSLLMIAGKVPPQATDFEEAILGAAMLEKGAFEKISEQLTPESFYMPHHQSIFKAMVRLSNKTMPIDSLTVVAELRAMGELETVGGPYKISVLSNAVASTAHIEGHCRVITEMYMKRELIRIGGQIVTEAYKDDSDVFELFEMAEKNILNVTTSNLKKDFRHISEGVADALKKIEQLKNREHSLTGVPTGYRDIDRITNGWQNTDLIIVAARPSVGKSAFALNLACNAAFSEEKPTPSAIFSLEMGENQLINRIMSSEAKIPLDWIQNGRLSDGKMIQLSAQEAPKIAAVPIYIDDTADLSVFELKTKCRRLKAKYNVGLIIVDYLQLMKGSKGKGNREQEIASITRDMKILAKELEIPIILLSQMSRDVEKRGGIPRLSDLRESGAIEQDADIVMFLYRPSIEDQKRDADLRNKGLVSFAKHRNGALEELAFYIDLSIQKWFNMDEGEEYARSFDKNKIPAKIENQFYTDPSESRKIDDDIDDMPF